MTICGDLWDTRRMVKSFYNYDYEFFIFIFSVNNYVTPELKKVKSFYHYYFPLISYNNVNYNGPALGLLNYKDYGNLYYNIICIMVKLQRKHFIL